MPKYFVFLLFMVSFLKTNAQENPYPQHYFTNPLDIPLVLSGTFGELRSNHFHSGLDFKTQQREGFKVYAAAQGYVSRIKISNWGYGKAVYITHPNGYTTVYGHLKKFNTKIESYLKKRQYQKESYTIQLFPKPGELPVEKGEIIAFSGSTGGYVGAHLHFEIRETETSTPINPLLFGFQVSDHKKPVINSLYAFPLSPGAQVHQSANPVLINITPQRDGNLLSDTITASGTIGLGINTFDRQDMALNRNGVYSIQLLLNGKTVYKEHVARFSFAHTRYINLHIDYKTYVQKKQRVQKCYIEPNNPLEIYDRNYPENGYLYIEDGKKYIATIIVKDIVGNKTKLTIPITGKKEEPKWLKPEHVTAYPVVGEEFNKFSKDGVTIAFPKNTFYEDFYLDFNVQNDGSVQLLPEDIPLFKSYTLTFDVSKYSEDDRKHLFIAHYNKGKYPSYSHTVRKEKSFYTRTKKMGKFALLSDFKAPVVKAHNFKDGQWLSKYNFLKIAMKDDLSGIKSYRGTIDGEWILLEWNLKKGILVYDFNDKKLSGTKHQLEVVVTDNANNTKTYRATFYRK